MLESAGIAGQFDVRISSDEVSHSKPDVDIVAKALEKAGVKASEAVLVGDTPYDLESARKAGVPFVGLRCGGWTDAELNGAAAIFDDPADLLDRWNASPFVGATMAMTTVAGRPQS